METKRFTKNDQGFICGHCGRQVKPLGYTSRNHCPFCLWSLHVDILPGDRANECGGLMEPLRVDPDPKKGFVITHRCTKCGFIGRNRAAHEADEQPDDLRLLISLTAGNETPAGFPKEASFDADKRGREPKSDKNGRRKKGR